jgi:hypothetical protein
VSGKHKHWHKAWSRDERGHLVHTSGLRVVVTSRPEGIDLVTDDASLDAFQTAELARGVTVAQLQERLRRLLDEAARWHLRQ